MAEKIDSSIPDDVDQILYVEFESENQTSYRGYKFDYLAQNLTEMEQTFVFCPKCSGIIREACSIQDSNLCLECCENEENPKPANMLRSSVSTLSIKCPLLRDCGWTGILIDSVKHLKECRVFLVECSLECGAVIKRCEIEDHIHNHCPNRTASCLFCDEIRLHKFIPGHLIVCHAYPVKCICGSETRRDQHDIHIETECPLAKIECPYAKYSCNIGAIFRKDLLTHKREFFIEHQDMIEQENCKLKEELYQLKEEQYQLKDNHHNLEGRCNDLWKRESALKQEYFQMKQSLRLKKQLYGIEISVRPTQSETTREVFNIGSYRFNCIVSVQDSINIELMRLSSSFGNDKNVICITDCVVCLKGTKQVNEPFSTNIQLSSRAVIGGTISIMEIRRRIFSLFIQPDGTLDMSVYFDYDYVTYKGLF
ncbi:TNF receptor-associated factor 6-like [Oopsacas minuta]|uniref:TNF receptor-associated factor 6-like n=1 Tax=Oopsacas minuta TaxID=111878 RepID=A0AAV7KB27_9METZ|nr:TNF receptor-associated factor 6-like [Oopsacas minuta]